MCLGVTILVLGGSLILIVVAVLILSDTICFSELYVRVCTQWVFYLFTIISLCNVVHFLSKYSDVTITKRLTNHHSSLFPRLLPLFLYLFPLPFFLSSETSLASLALLLKLYTFVYRDHHNHVLSSPHPCHPRRLCTMLAYLLSFLLLGNLFILFFRFTATFAASCSRTYVVKDGDYCDKISQDQNVSTFVLRFMADFTQC